MLSRFPHWLGQAAMAIFYLAMYPAFLYPVRHLSGGALLDAAIDRLLCWDLTMTVAPIVLAWSLRFIFDPDTKSFTLAVGRVAVRLATLGWLVFGAFITGTVVYVFAEWLVWQPLFGRPMPKDWLTCFCGLIFGLATRPLTTLMVEQVTTFATRPARSLATQAR